LKEGCGGWSYGRADPDADRSRAIIRALQYVESHLDSPLPLEAVARIAGMSKFHFCRRFRAVIGLPFRAFLTQQRIARAKALLRDEGQRISDVARAVGYQDVTHFGRVFRKVEGLLPSQFRLGRAVDTRTGDARPTPPNGAAKNGG
jgi:AraC family transcriptional regulator